jgi:hypothetical protein
MDDRPTARQMQYLRDLANKTGQSFAYPKTKRDASREINRLKKVSAGPIRRANRRRDAHEVMRAIRAELAAATAVGDVETTGHGSTAHWAQPAGAEPETTPQGETP